MLAPISVQVPSELLDQAALFRALACGFAYPGEGKRAQFLASLARLRARTRTNGRSARRLERLRRVWAQASEAELAADYTRLLVGGEAARLRETAYGDALRIGWRAAELADIAGFYAAFAMQSSSAEPDLPDHVSAELEFYSVLLIKLAYAASRGNAGQYAVTLRAARRFLEDHLGRWIGALASELEHSGAAAPYRALAHATQRWIEEACRHLRARPSRIAGRLPYDEMQGTEFTCPREERAQAY